MNEVTVKTLPPITAAFIRHVGPYADCGAAWEKLCGYPGVQKTFGPDTLFFGICYDDPDVTEADKLRCDICREILRRDDPILRAIGHGGAAGRDGIAHGRKLRHIRHDLPVAAAGRHDDVIPARKRCRNSGLRARCDLFLGIEQCAVHIDGDELICHGTFLSAQFHSVYCTRFNPTCQPDVRDLNPHAKAAIMAADRFLRSYRYVC